MAVSKAVYQVLEKDGHFEIRSYEPMVLAISRETDLRGYSGFNVLFSYISGNNQASKKISMTAPVLNNLDEQDLTTSFVMPNQYKHLDDLPQPNGMKFSSKSSPWFLTNPIKPIPETI